VKAVIEFTQVRDCPHYIFSETEAVCLEGGICVRNELAEPPSWCPLRKEAGA
jgi:hypothetical protein